MFIRKFYLSFVVKAKYAYMKAMSRALYLIVGTEMFTVGFNNQKQNEQLHIRFQNRFRIFDNVYFLKKVQFEELKNTCASDFNVFQSLAEKTEYLKQQFSETNRSLDVLAEDGLCPEKIKKQAQKLKRLSVISAL